MIPTVKTKYDSLFTLIKSLNQSEKGYFKKFTSLHKDSKQNIYIKLFNAMDGLKEYNQADFIKKFSRESFTKHLGAKKHYLINIILKSLNAYYSGIWSETHVRSLMLNIRILMSKGLNKEAGKLLEKAKQLAEKQHNPLLMIEILYLSNLYYIQETHLQFFDNFIERFSAEAMYQLEKEADRMQTYILRNKITVFIQRNGNEADPEELKKLFGDEISMLEKRDLSGSAKESLYRACIIYYIGTGDLISAAKYAFKNIALWEKDKSLIREHPGGYIVGLHELMRVLLNAGQYEKFWEVTEKLKQVPQKYQSVMSEFAYHRFFGTYILVLDAYIKTGEFNRGVAFAESLGKEFKRFLETTPLMHATFCINLSFLYFGAGRFHESLKWVNLFLNDASMKNIRPELNRIVRILNLMINIELGNLDALEYLIKSAHRYVLKHKKIYAFESLILRFFNKLPDVGNQALFKKWSQELKKELGSLRKTPVESNLLADILILPWLESKISGKPMEEIQKRLLLSS